MSANKKSLLVILDGWGLGQVPESDAVANAKTPYFDSLMRDFPNAALVTYGMEVGLPEGQMGNSEVGHLNIGAGRIVYQELARINKAIQDDTLKETAAIKEAIAYAKSQDKTVHLMGLVSDGGVHSHVEHLKALVTLLDDAGVERVKIHAFTDGRDTDPKRGKVYLKEIENHIQGTNAKIATVIGRYYAMDRDERWERIQKAYDLLIKGVGTYSTDLEASLQGAYDAGKTDEFVDPILLDKEGLIKEDDVVFFFNFRTDRPRQITRVLTQEDKADFGMHKLPLYFVTMVNYNKNYNNIHVVYDKDAIVNTIGEVIQDAGLTQVRIAETEKYPHVTFFLNGGREAEFEGEDRLLCPSPKVATYDLAPEMSAGEITTAITDRIKSNAPDFICLNYANADMVGHTGDFNAAMKACEVVDDCLEKLTKTALEHDYEIIVIADHGNSDYMINADGSPNTAHTTNPVPIIYVSNNTSEKNIMDGKLADIAPTLLGLMGVDAPVEMTGDNILRDSLIQDLKKKSVELVAVSKTKPVEAILEIYNQGIRDFGENRVQEMVEKYEILSKDIRWHQIGRLQKNKVKYIAPFVALIHSVDSLELLETINKQATRFERVIPILLQVKIAEEDSKAGLAKPEVLKIIELILVDSFSNIELRGFMGMATFTDDKAQVRLEFRDLKAFQLECIQAYPRLESSLQILSMGMSGDYELAISEGANMVRIGSKIFGTRN